MDIHEYTLWEVGYSGSLQDIANILEYPQEQVLFSGILYIIPYIKPQIILHIVPYYTPNYHVYNAHPMIDLSYELKS